MTTKQKATLCAFGAGLLALIGSMSPLCALVPPPWSAVCLAGGTVAGEAAKRITVSDAGEP